MNRFAVYHTSSGSYCYPTGANTLRLRLRTAKGDVSAVAVRYMDLYDHGGAPLSAAADKLLSDELFDYYECEVTLESKRFKYYFELTAPEGTVCYSAEGFGGAAKHAEMFYYPYINADDVITMPEWAKGRTIYQIWVDRFFNGDSDNDPARVRDTQEPPDRSTYYGGDFDGVMQKLPYLSGLGVGVIYLNPVFRSPTYHKYDISDYYAVEETFGGAEKLRELVKKAHENDIRVVLDCVFNHCSDRNELFADVVRNGERSKYKDWFCIRSFPVDTERGNYDSFGGLVPSMPRFNTANPEVIDYLVGAAAYWTRELDLDGWRLDVADEVSHRLWREFRRRLTAIQPNLLIIGEIWNHATQWLAGDEMHTATHYRGRKHAVDFALGEIGAAAFFDKYNADRSLYKTPVFDCLINLMGSHDTMRIASLIDDNRVTRLLMLLTLTLPGLPLIYYGDELPMRGGEDPDNRRAMRWELAAGAFQADIARVVRLRRESPALAEGRLVPLPAGERCLCFLRESAAQTALVALNFSEETVIVAHAGREITVDPLDCAIVMIEEAEDPQKRRRTK